jgi:hypothetical protein
LDLGQGVEVAPVEGGEVWDGDRGGLVVDAGEPVAAAVGEGLDGRGDVVDEEGGGGFGHAHDLDAHRVDVAHEVERAAAVEVGAQREDAVAEAGRPHEVAAGDD